MYICAAVLVLAGFMSLAIPVFRFHLTYEKTQYTAPETGFSIVVAFRNEANNLPALYSSICAFNYPRHLIEWVLATTTVRIRVRIGFCELNKHRLSELFTAKTQQKPGKK